jgi:hypothetical protein
MKPIYLTLTEILAKDGIYIPGHLSYTRVITAKGNAILVFADGRHELLRNEDWENDYFQEVNELIKFE